MANDCTSIKFYSFFIPLFSSVWNWTMNYLLLLSSSFFYIVNVCTLISDIDV